MYVIDNESNKSKFKPKRIKDKIIEETKLDEDTANKITQSVVNSIKENYEDVISTNTIRSLINANLIKRGLILEEEKSRKLGMSVSDYEKLIKDGCRDNANISKSPEMVSKYAYDSIAKEYALLTMPEDCAKAHIDGLYHCLSGNNDLIVKIDDIIQVMNIVDVIDNLSDTEVFVPSINVEKNIIEWKKIINGCQTGFKEIVEVTFNKGRKIEVTKNHKFIKINSNNKIAKKFNYTINDLEAGNISRLALVNKIPYNFDDNYLLSALYGFFLGDGTVNKTKIQFHLVKEDKIKYIINILEKLNLDYKINEYDYATYIGVSDLLDLFRDKYSLPNFKLNTKGLLEGLINSDGYITQHGGKNNNYLEFDNTNKFIINLYQMACLTVGINPSINYINNKIYRCLSQGKEVDELLHSIDLRDGHNIIDGLFKNKSYNLSQGSIKSIKNLGMMPVYNITVEDNHNFLAGTLGFIPVQNCHDLEYYNLRPNCLNIDLRFFAKNGLKIDGKGLMGSVAKPAKSLEVLLNHMLQVLMAGATVLSGGQGYVNFNTLLAPYCSGKTYQEIKQAIQGFIFNCNMSLICRGGQVLFSSIALDLSTPKELANERAVCPGGVYNGVYADYKEEADLIFRAVCEVLNEKDGEGAYHRFPNTLFNIRKGDLDEYKGNCKLLHELGANNPTIYYSNCESIERTTMGCRTSLPMNYAYDYKKDCINTGNFMYNTINLPLIALETNTIDEFYTKLDEICELIYKSLHHRREKVLDILYNKHLSDFLIQRDKDTDEEFYDIDTTTLTIGFCGLNECLEVLFNGDIVEFEDEGIKIVEFLNDKKVEFNKRDGLRWSVIGSPAESTAHRFATIIKNKYPNAKVQGTKGAYYLTNSSHIPVSAGYNLVEHIKNASKFHPLTLGGNILHLWLGEVWSDPKAIWKLNQKIMNTGTIFWAYSKVFTFCNECGFTINEKCDECPVCKSKDVITYDRITGYYLPTVGFNDGKQQEFKDRNRQKVEV